MYGLVRPPCTMGVGSVNENCILILSQFGVSLMDDFMVRSVNRP